MIKLRLRLDDDRLKLRVGLEQKLKLKLCPTEGKLIPVYTGGYSVTPSTFTTILMTKDKRMTDNVVVDPIPSNYGLITWNGSFLTVS